MTRNLKDIRLTELSEVLSRAKFARQADVSEKIIKRVEEGDYSPREDTQVKIINAVNAARKRTNPYTLEEVFRHASNKSDKLI